LSGSTELRIAEMLNTNAKYTEIRDKLRVGSETIKSVKEMVASGIIAFDEDGKAYYAKPAQKSIEEIHAQVMEVVTKKATETALMNAEEDYALGNSLRQNWSVKAQDAGVSVHDYVRSALIFYDEYKDEIEEIEKNKAVARWALQKLQGEMVRVAKMELFYKFVRYSVYLREKGFTVPQRLIYDFYNDLTVLEKGGNLKVEREMEGEERRLGM